MIDAHAIGALFATPVSESAVVARLTEIEDSDLADTFNTWMLNAQSSGWLSVSEFSKDETGRQASAVVSASEIAGLVRFHFRPTRLEVQRLVERLEGGSDLDTCHVLVCPDPDGVTSLNALGDVAIGIGGGQVLIMGPEWTASIAIEQLRPLLYSGASDESAEAPYFEFDSEDAMGTDGIDVRRASRRSATLIPDVEEDSASYEEKLREIRRGFPVLHGSTLLASVFLPPITHSPASVERFYSTRFGMRAENAPLIAERYAYEVRQFEDHISQYQRIDMIDRGVLEEYLNAPEYYQMPLTVEELRAQVDNVLRMLEHENYSLCLCPEAISISFEIREGELRIRSDRRNKAEPRQGRVTGLTFRNPGILEMFEREFWTLYRGTEAEFKAKDHVSKWLIEKASGYQEL